MIVGIFIRLLLCSKPHESLATVILFILHRNPLKMIIKILISQGRSHGSEGSSKLLKSNNVERNGRRTQIQVLDFATRFLFNTISDLEGNRSLRKYFILIGCYVEILNGQEMRHESY